MNSECGQLTRGINARPYEDGDYEMFSGWCRDWGYQAIPKALLSTQGLIIEVGNVPTVVGWLYQTNSNMSMIRWVVCNKAVDKMDRHEAVDALLESLHEQSRKLGFEFLFIPADGNNDRWNKRLKNHGWVHTDENVNLYLRRL